MASEDPFWREQPSILFRADRIFEFFPAEGMTRSEKLNAIARFGVYGSAVLYTYSGDVRSLYVALAAFFVSWFLFYEAKGPEGFREHEKVHVAASLDEVRDPLAEKTARLGFVPTQELPENSDKPFAPRPGVVGSFGSADAVPPSLVRRPDGAVCVAPTRNNPYMNVLMSDYADAPDRPAACQLVEPDVLKAADEHANHNLYRDVTDLFGTMTNNRNFYTMPSTTIPNDRDGFARFCFSDVNKGCKAGHLETCLRNTDLRQKRGNIDEVLPMMSSPVAATTATWE